MEGREREVESTWRGFSTEREGERGRGTHGSCFVLCLLPSLPQATLVTRCCSLLEVVRVEEAALSVGNEFKSCWYSTRVEAGQGGLESYRGVYRSKERLPRSVESDKVKSSVKESGGKNNHDAFGRESPSLSGRTRSKTGGKV